MNIRLVAILVAAILLAHAVLIHLILRTDSMAAASAEKKAIAEQQQKEEKSDDFLSGIPSGGIDTADDPGQSKTPAGSENADVRPGIPSVRSGSPQPKKNIALDYSRAVHGKIPGISGLADSASGILVDLNTNRVLWEKNSAQAHPDRKSVV